MSSPFLDALANERRITKLQREAMFCIVVLSLVAMWLIHRAPHHLTFHPAPNMRAGDSILVTAGVAPVPDPNVYGFGYYIWQQLNRWARDGARDYAQQIFAFQSYITPACQDQLKNDEAKRARAGELVMRTRALAEIPGQAYSASRVIPDGDNAWTVLLDMHIVETVRGVPVKDAFIRYPLRVVRYDVDREKNPWGLAIDCFGGNRPERIDAVLAGSGATAPPSLSPAPLQPTQPARSTPPPPASLPAAAAATGAKS